MSSLREIRRHLRSIENLKKITDAMGMVAAVLLRKAQAKAEHSQPYIAKMKECLENLALLTDSQHPLLQQREVKKTGVVIIAADRGLSGSYNTTVFAAANAFLKTHTPQSVELILLGKKTVDYYKRRSWPIRHQIVNWGGKITLAEIHSLSQQLVNWYLSGSYDEIWLVYTHFNSIINKQVRIEKFLNIGSLNAKQTSSYASCIFEPNTEEIINAMLPRYCNTRIQAALYNAYASELAARIIAMRAASKNSKELVEALTIERNKIRQRDITREMIEITAGAEGL